MGLDIYLYPQAASEANKKHYEIWNEDAEGNCRAASMTDDERKAWDEQHPYVRQEDVPSERHPDHLFNRRYLRSSYNGSGFNRAVPQILGVDHDLYWIFEPMGREWDGDEGRLTTEDIPKLQAAKTRALEVAEALQNSDRLRVITISPNMFSGQPKHSDEDALRIYREHVAERSIQVGDDDWYSTMGGDLNVYGGGVQVIAAIPGIATFGIPGVHLLYRASDDAFDSYIQSAEITAEFCDEAIALIERDGSCEMSWSG